VKSGKGGINWYRYQKLILKPLLIPFAKVCMEDRPETVVQEDNAGPHAARYQQEVFDLAEVMRLTWPSNSPDLNMIEPCWFYMKRETTKQGPHSSIKQMKAAWVKCWEELPQEKDSSLD